jgi:hypothetical protein
LWPIDGVKRELAFSPNPQRFSAFGALEGSASANKSHPASAPLPAI